MSEAVRARLTHRQINFLWRIDERPCLLPTAWTAWLHDLWAGGYFDAIGHSAYITDKGRSAIRPLPSEEERR